METIELELLGAETLDLDLKDSGSLEMELDRSTGTSNYAALSNKPQIEGHTLIGNSTIQQIGVDALPVSEIEKILYL